MNRREFLQSLALLGIQASVLQALPLRGFAAGSLPEFFLLIHVQNGWDTTLAMDPWTESQAPTESDYYLEYKKDELVPFANGFVTENMNGLKKYFDRMAVFNGVFMNSQDNGHEGLARYAMSGNGQGTLSSLPAELEGRKFKSEFGTVSNGNVFSSGKASFVWNTSRILNGDLSPIEYLQEVQGKTELERALKSFETSKQKINNFNAILAKLKAGAPTPHEGHAIAAAFASGLSYSSFLNVSDGNLDTHQSHPGTHKKALGEVIQKIAGYLDVLAATEVQANSGVSLLDQTTVLIVSEFTRTPALNSSQGKDHNPQCNSALLLSRKVKQGIVGKSKLVTRAQSTLGSPYLAGLPLDKKTLAAVERRTDCFIMRPENVIATTLGSMNVDPGAVSTGLKEAQILTSILK